MALGVAELCQQHELTFDDLVSRSGLDDNKVRAILLGRWTPSPAERKRIADVFEVAVDEVVWGHRTPIQHIYGHGPG
ncbi:MAG: helix-turn-helix transcriptional regulator [Pirellulaceae bacterium]|jgi:transcriptional regulator with XRE-family HTH domain|nr:XRE family transcriptional regulator [Planctomycetaceae bacterium]HIM29298.1 XRE family transcriptional regulator [Planctomycetota bacterium]